MMKLHSYILNSDLFKSETITGGGAPYKPYFLSFSGKKEIVDAFVKSVKNRNREKPTFANINLMGKCNLKCFFCIGNELKNISEQVGKNITKISQLNVHFKEWKNFSRFLKQTKDIGIEKLYLTGMNTDPALYKYLPELIKYLKKQGFKVGIRTNGYYYPKQMPEVLSSLNSGISYSIHSVNPDINKKIIGTSKMPDWNIIIPKSGENCRVATVVNRYNEDDILNTIKYLSKFPNLKYIQLRSICSDIENEKYTLDTQAFENLKNKIAKNFSKIKDYKGYPVYNVYGKEVSFWDPLQVTINSTNYFTDGTISNSYFVTEGYSKSKLLK